MKTNLLTIFNRFKESYLDVLESDFLLQNKSLYLENLKESNQKLIHQLFGEEGLKKFDTLMQQELKNF